MIKFNRNTGKLELVSVTPRATGIYEQYNRKTRRAMVFPPHNMKLHNKVVSLETDLKLVGVTLEKQRLNGKQLSGYYSQLLSKAEAVARDVEETIG